MTDLTAIGSSTWLWAGASGIVYYALAFWFYIIGLKRIPASLAGLFLNLIPIFAVGGAYLFLGERLAAVQWVGAALILTAVMVMLRFQNREGISKAERLQAENVTGVGWSLRLVGTKFYQGELNNATKSQRFSGSPGAVSRFAARGGTRAAHQGG